MDSENLAYRGITSGESQCAAYRGYICGLLVKVWRDVLRLKVTIQRSIHRKVEL